MITVIGKDEHTQKYAGKAGYNLVSQETTPPIDPFNDILFVVEPKLKQDDYPTQVFKLLQRVREDQCSYQGWHLVEHPPDTLSPVWTFCEYLGNENDYYGQIVIGQYRECYWVDVATQQVIFPVLWKPIERPACPYQLEVIHND
jgi:hypothetical protein